MLCNDNVWLKWVYNWLYIQFLMMVVEKAFKNIGPKFPIVVQLVWDLVTVKAIAYDSHHFHTCQTIQWPLCVHLHAHYSCACIFFGIYRVHGTWETWLFASMIRTVCRFLLICVQLCSIPQHFFNSMTVLSHLHVQGVYHLQSRCVYVCMWQTFPIAPWVTVNTSLLIRGDDAEV